MCVKYGGLHNSKECKRIYKGTPAKCALCGGKHPANYKGCEYYHNLIKGNNTFRNNTQRTPPVHTDTYIYIYTTYNVLLTSNNQEVTQI
jgi:hypothetical protein